MAKRPTPLQQLKQSPVLHEAMTAHRPDRLARVIRMAAENAKGQGGGTSPACAHTLAHKQLAIIPTHSHNAALIGTGIHSNIA